MIRVVCDTMVWYELAKGRLPLPDPEKYQLVCTHLSLMEIAFSGNNFHKLEEIKSVIAAIMRIRPSFIPHDPYSYARSLVDKDFTLEYNVEEDLVMGFLRVLLHQPKEVLEEGSFKDSLADIAARRKENSLDWADFKNRLHKPMIVAKSVIKKYEDHQSNLENARKWLLFQLNQLNDIQLDVSTDLSCFELYTNVYARYIRNLEISNLRADRNDENDLKNMIYVQPGEKYWTLEKRWLSIIREIQLENYLYS